MARAAGPMGYWAVAPGRLEKETLISKVIILYKLSVQILSTEEFKE